MALDSDERKIAALFAAFEEINAQVDRAGKQLTLSVGRLDPTVRQTIRDVLNEELSRVHHEVGLATAALQRMRRAADWRQLLIGTGLSALVVLVTLGGFWLFTPSPAEMTRLRAEREQLQDSIDLLARRGGRAELKNCGTSNEHLCVRVETGLGRYGDGKDYFVIRGY